MAIVRTPSVMVDSEPSVAASDEPASSVGAQAASARAAMAARVVQRAVRTACSGVSGWRRGTGYEGTRARPRAFHRCTASHGERATMGHRHYNGLKTAALFGVMWAVLLGIGWLLGRGTPKFLLLFTVLGLVDDGVQLLELRQDRDPRDEGPAGERDRAAGDVPDRARALHRRPPADAAPLHLADGRAQRLRHRPQPEERRGLLHRGHPADPRRARAARRPRPRAHARLQPRHPHVLGGRGRGRA